MVCRNIIIKNPSGLHLQPATILAKIAAGCKSDITLVKGEKRVNPKSVIFLMSGNIAFGEEITVECDGESEMQDLETIISAIDSGLGELDNEPNK